LAIAAEELVSSAPPIGSYRIPHTEPELDCIIEQRNSANTSQRNFPLTLPLSPLGRGRG